MGSPFVHCCSVEVLDQCLLNIHVYMHRLSLYQAFIRLKVLKISDGGVCSPKWDILSCTSNASGALLKRVGRNKEPETMLEISDDGVLRPK